MPALRATPAQKKLLALVLEQITYQYGWGNEGNNLLDNVFTCFGFHDYKFYYSVNGTQENMLWKLEKADVLESVWVKDDQCIGFKIKNKHALSHMQGWFDEVYRNGAWSEQMQYAITARQKHDGIKAGKKVQIQSTLKRIGTIIEVDYENETAKVKMDHNSSTLDMHYSEFTLIDLDINTIVYVVGNRHHNVVMTVDSVDEYCDKFGVESEVTRNIMKSTLNAGGIYGTEQDVYLTMTHPDTKRA